jgi:hypothetical protein
MRMKKTSTSSKNRSLKERCQSSKATKGTLQLFDQRRLSTSTEIPTAITNSMMMYIEYLPNILQMKDKDFRGPGLRIEKTETPWEVILEESSFHLR